MSFKPPVTLLKAVLVAIVVALLGYIGLDIPRDIIEQTVNEQFDAMAKEESSSITEVGSPGTVVRIIDGDTVIVQVLGGIEEKVRLIGIDTPETEFSPSGIECFATEATEFATQLLLNEPVLLFSDSSQSNRDKYNRLLAYINLINSDDFGELMIRGG